MPQSGALTRRLLAVAVLDVVNYSRLMERDESGTHAAVDEAVSQVVTPAVGAAAGRIVDRAGDGLLLEFRSSSDAVKCALAIQGEMSKRNENIDPEKRVQFRVGINVGDIIVDHDRIIGDVVNVAARLEAMAEPGGVCISVSVREQLREDLGARIEDIGEVHVKNIARPIRAFRIRQMNKVAPHRARLFQITGRAWKWSLYFVLAIVLVAVARLGLPFFSDRSARSAPGMSLVVIPFRATGSGLDDEAAEAITREVTRGLAATPWIPVIAPNVASTIRSDAGDVGAVGRELNVRYLVFGRVQRHDGMLGVDAQLIDASKAVAAWASHVNVTDGPTANSEIVLRLVVPLREAVYNTEAKKLVSSGATPTTPMEYKMYGDSALDEQPNTLKANRTARRFYEQALKLDPNFAPVLLSWGYSLIRELELYPTVDRAAVVHEMEELSKHIVAMDADSAPGWQFRSEALARQWRWDAALDASEKSLALDPGRAWAYSQRASIMVRLGRPLEALQLVDRALALADQKVGFALFQRCRAHMALGNYREAIAACQKSTSREDWWMPHAYLASAYALVGDGTQANQEKETLLRARPGASVAAIESLGYSSDAAFVQQSREHLYFGLHNLGL